jgi:hypothetical protein
MAASTITRDIWLDDTGTPAAPAGDGTIVGNFQLQNHIYARIDQMSSGAGGYTTLTFGGKIAVDGFGVHTFSAGGAGGNVIAVRNTSGGTTNYAGLLLGNDASISAGFISETASNYAAAGSVPQDGMVLGTARPGGVSISAEHASGAIRFYAGTATERARLQASGAFLVGNVTEDTGGGSAYFEKTDAGDLNLSQVLTVSRKGGSNATSNRRWAGVVFRDADAQTYTGAVAGCRQNPSANYAGGVSIFGKVGSVASQATAPSDLSEVVRIGYQDAFMGCGMKMLQGGFDDEILSFSSSDVAHSFTTATNTDNYGTFRKAAVSSGGVALGGYTGDKIGVNINGNYVNGDTTKGGSAGAAILIIGNKLNVNTPSTMGANENILVLKDNVNTRHIFDADGDYHYDGAAPANYDAWDDVSLTRALDLTFRGPEVIDGAFDRFVTYNRADLERAGIVSAGGFVNLTRHTRLLNGAIWQLHQRLARLEMARP